MDANNPKPGEPPGKDWPISEPAKGKKKEKKSKEKLGIVKGWLPIMLERITPLR